MRQAEHNKPSAGNCPAYRTPSISSASPHRRHKVVDCTEIPRTQSSQTGEKPDLRRGPPQALQSAGYNVVTRSSSTARATRPGSISKREITRPSATPPSGAPGGPPEAEPSALSFKHSLLKTHLTRRHKQISCHFPQYSPVAPCAVNNSCTFQGSPVLHLGNA
jgi:hypothetical protein